MNLNHLKERRLWIMISGHKVSGSESRAVKVAAYFASQNIFKEVIFACNRELLEAYKQNKELFRLLFENEITIVEKNRHENGLFSHEIWNNKMITTYLNIFFRGGKWFPVVYRKLLRLFSWEKFIRKNIRENDIVHGIWGVPVMVAVLSACKSMNNPFILELTGPNLVNRYKYYFHSFFRDREKAKNLYFMAVSQTNFERYKKFIGMEFFETHDIHYSYYEGPFVGIPGTTKKQEKENIIIFPHRFFGRKNAPLFAKSVKTLMDQGRLNGWKVYFRGSGRDEAIIRDTLNEYIQKGTVDIGYTENILEEFAKAKICVSIISTDNTPSNSIYESLKHGNLQILSDTGYTKDTLDHPDLFYCDLNEKSLMIAILNAVHVSESEIFEEKSQSMRDYYEHLVKNNLYVKKALQLYTGEVK